MIREKVFFVDDEEHLRIAGSQTFDLAHMDVQTFDAAETALSALTPEFDGVLVTDIRMPGMDGVTLLKKVLAIDPEIPVIIVTGHGDVALAVACLTMGAYDFVEKPWQADRLVSSVRRAAERRALILENRSLRNAARSGQSFRKELYGRSAAMLRVHKTLSDVAATDVNVLISGDTGTGKEVAARSLHRSSARANGPFVHINCAALPEAMIESELFGHEIGAFPGAMRSRYGKLEHARGGTLCLDEIDLLPLSAQAKLLDVLHNRKVTRLGSNDPIALDFRVVAMTKTNLEEAAAAGRFRSDLLFRLNVAAVHLPDLSARREDIPGLFTRLSAEIAQHNDLPLPDIPVELLNNLSARAWPGNVRALRNEAERFVLGLTETLEPAGETNQRLVDQVQAYEKALIAAAIAANSGQVKAACDSLGLSRRALYDKMQKYGLSRSEFTDES